MWSFPVPVLIVADPPDVADAETVKPEMVRLSFPLPRFTVAVPAPIADAAAFKSDRSTFAPPGPKTLMLIAPTPVAEPEAVMFETVSV